MFEGLISFFKRFAKNEEESAKSKDTAKERLHLVLMQDRANVSADFLEMMKQEIIDVIKKYIDVDEKEIDVKLTNKTNEDGTIGAPALYANIPIANIKNENKDKDEKRVETDKKEENKQEAKDKKEENKSENSNESEENKKNIKEQEEQKIKEKDKAEESNKEKVNKDKQSKQDKNDTSSKEKKTTKPVSSKKKKK